MNIKSRFSTHNSGASKSVSSHRGVRWTAAGLAVAAVPVLGMAGASAANAATPAASVGNSSNYSLAQTVVNSSAQTLTLTSIRTDNGAAIQQGYLTTIEPGHSGTYTVTNHGNGAQLWINFTGSTGAKVSVDTDVPKTMSNWANDQVTANGAFAASYSLSGGKTATGSFTIASGATNGTQSTYQPVIPGWGMSHAGTTAPATRTSALIRE